MEEAVSKGKGSKSSKRKNKNAIAKGGGSRDTDGDSAAAGMAGGADDVRIPSLFERVMAQFVERKQTVSCR